MPKGSGPRDEGREKRRRGKKSCFISFKLTCVVCMYPLPTMNVIIATNMYFKYVFKR